MKVIRCHKDVSFISNKSSKNTEKYDKIEEIDRYWRVALWLKRKNIGEIVN